jgi:parallel beta-helix repeat protein
MNDEHRFERALADSLASIGVPAPTDRAIEETLSRAGAKRQRPRWIALIKEPSMHTESRLAVGSPTARVMAIMVATLLVLAVAAGGIAGSRLLAAEAAIVVDPSGAGDTTTITEAVAMAEDGALVLVHPGIYDEEITLNKAITIRGDGERDEIIIEVSRPLPGFEPDLPAAFRFEDSGAVVEHLTVRGDSSLIIVNGGSPILRDLVLDGIGLDYGMDATSGAQSVPSGIDMVGGSTATIEASTFLGANISLTFASAPTISENTFIGDETGSADIWMEGGGVDPQIIGNTFVGNVGEYITVWGGAKPTIQGNDLDGANTGISIEDGGFWTSDKGSDPVIGGNRIAGANTGISVDTGASATIDTNVLVDNAIGIALTGTDALIVNNEISGGSAGIAVIASGSPTLDGNTVQGATSRGITIGGTSSPTLTGNTVCGNATNLFLDDTATPDIGENEICEDGLVEATE